jgi:alkylhydroperoxidase/carboxymuconolactone decarboxylase family protein YurZ
MPLIPYANIDDLPDEAKAVFDGLPIKLNILRMFANAQSCFAPYMRFGTALLTRQKLDPTVREIIILQVVHIEGGEYEWIQHVPIGLALGVTQAQIARLRPIGTRRSASTNVSAQ